MQPHRLAAAVVLMRRSPAGPQVYLTLRSKKLAFMGGFHAFPGGTVDKIDKTVQVGGAQGETDSAQISAAIRELFEECGVLAARGAERLSAATLEQLRRDLLADSRRWPAQLQTHGLHLDMGALMRFGRWITPPFSPMRFDAQYFALWLPEGASPSIWPGELVEGLWMSAREALLAHDRSDVFLSYPVIETLKVVDHHGEALEAAAAELHARGPDAYPHAGGEMLAGVHIVPLPTPTLPPATHTNTYVIGRDELVVIDPAPVDDAARDALVGYLRHLTRGGARLREIWLTHQHPDHVGATHRLRDTFKIPVAAHPLTIEALRGEIDVDRGIDDAERTKLGEASWVALHTPGHARGHLCFYEERLGTLISGDLIVSLGTVIVAAPDGDMVDYMASLMRVRDLPRHGFLFPAHGPPIAATREKVDEYIAHRLQRETAILAALDAPRAPSDIVPLVYTDVPHEVWPLAEQDVRSHLDKLVREGRATRRSDGRFARGR